MPRADKAVFIQNMLSELELKQNGYAPTKTEPDSKEWWREVAQELGVRANSLERTNARLREQGQHLAHALDVALKVLDGVEWSPSLPWDDSCPCCTEHESDGHAPTCELAAARVVLRRARASISGGTTDAAESDRAALWARVERLSRSLNQIQDERAASFERLDVAVGGTGLTPYQPEIDIAIECRIKALRARVEALEGLLLRGAWHRHRDYPHMPVSPENRERTYLAIQVHDGADLSSKATTRDAIDCAIAALPPSGEPEDTRPECSICRRRDCRRDHPCE